MIKRYMRHTGKLFALGMLWLTGWNAVHAQSVTYNHDSSKKNQVTVMETGSGALTPEIYYTLLHNNYKKSAAAKNKLSFRTQAGIHSYSQVGEAEAIDSALTKRAEIEALNMADRTVDLAWLAEGDKLNAQMENFKKNIDQILLVGGTPTEKERWSEYYHVYNCAIQATKDAYMPNAQRKKEYLRIYADVNRQNDILVKYLVRLHNAGKTQEMLSASSVRTTDNGSIAAEAMNRWKTARQEVHTSSSGNGNENTDNGHGEETVER